jgi:hypothetical protein
MHHVFRPSWVSHVLALLVVRAWAVRLLLALLLEGMPILLLLRRRRRLLLLLLLLLLLSLVWRTHQS